jgi:Ni,Fe-hydrogenase III large subunit
MTTALVDLETKEQVNLFQLLAKTIGVSFEILNRKKEKKLDAIEISRQEAKDGQVYHYDNVEDFFKKISI